MAPDTINVFRFIFLLVFLSLRGCVAPEAISSSMGMASPTLRLRDYCPSAQRERLAMTIIDKNTDPIHSPA